MGAMRHFEVKLKRSAYHWPKSQCETLKTLGLTKFGKTVYLKDTPAVRGILYKVVHAIEVAAHDGPPPKSHRQQRLRGCT